MSKKFMLLIVLSIVSLIVCGALSYYFINNTTEPHTNTTNDNAPNSKEHNNTKEQDVTSIPLEKPPFVKGE